MAAQIVGFMQQFLDVFKELQGKNFYVSGESVSASSRIGFDGGANGGV